MQTYYVAELQNFNSYRVAEKIQAKNLTVAKRKATRIQSFYGTLLKIAGKVDSNGFIDESSLYAYKTATKWINN